jgi:asparagine synthase (glutamine-hydrolysing)
MEEVKERLVLAVRKCTAGEKKVGILFSGGVDSSVIAKIASEFCDVTCYCAGLEGSHDIEFSKEAADALDLGIVTRILDEKEIPKYAEKVAKAIGTRDRTQVGVGIPLYACCEIAEEKVLLTGAGADEIFGGYARFKRLDGKELSEEMARTFEKMLAVDAKRDVAIGKANGKTIRMPYLDTGLKPLGEVGKPTLRKIALQLGMPKFIAEKPKKAAQYGSGVGKILKSTFSSAEA